MVEVIINGVSIDLISKTVKYTKQVNDLADLSTVNTSFTYSIQVDKTPKNTTLFKNLGMIGDTSDFPYVQNLTQLIDNGTMLISNGISIVKETGEDYKIHIQDGIIEVFKLLENKTIGTDLDLTELEHDKTAPVIIESFTKETYRYLISDYNGRTNVGFGILDGQYLTPSVNSEYLWNKVFEFLGYTYSGNFDISNKWITYPTEGGESADVLVFKGSSDSYKLYGDNLNYGPWEIEDEESYDQWAWNDPPTGLTIIDNWKLKVEIENPYLLKVQALGLMQWWVSPTGNHHTYIPFKVIIKKNGTEIDGLQVLSNEPQLTDLDLGILHQGDLIELEIIPMTIQEASDLGYNLGNADPFPDGLKVQTIYAELYSTAFSNYNFKDAFSKFKIKDFLKEIMFREALTPFVDNNSKHIEFLNLSERLDVSNAIDLSNKYIKRTNEQYTFEDYAQKNILRLKYNNEENSYNDGSLLTPNRNIKDEKILFESVFFSPERLPSKIIFHPLLPVDNFQVLKIWEKEVSEEQDEEGNTIQVINYNGLTDRFYYVSSKLEEKEININGLENPYFPKATLEGVSFGQIVLSKYSDINKIFTDTRIHQIELALSAYDFAVLDLKKPVYFDQEKQFYIVNKIIWESGKPAKGEFLRVKNI